MKKDNWIYKVFFITFILAEIFSGLSNIISAKFNSLILTLIILLVTGIGKLRKKKTFMLKAVVKLKVLKKVLL